MLRIPSTNTKVHKFDHGHLSSLTINTREFSETPRGNDSTTEPKGTVVHDLHRRWGSRGNLPDQATILRIMNDDGHDIDNLAKKGLF